MVGAQIGRGRALADPREQVHPHRASTAGDLRGQLLRRAEHRIGGGEPVDGIGRVRRRAERRADLGGLQHIGGRHRSVDGGSTLAALIRRAVLVGVGADQQLLHRPVARGELLAELTRHDHAVDHRSVVMLAEHTLADLEQARRIDASQRLDVGRTVRIESARELKPALLLGLERADARPAEVTAALDDGAMHQTSRRRRQHQGRDIAAARRLAEQRHPVRIAAEGGDVALHPTQRLELVVQTEIGCDALAREPGMGEEPEHTEPIGDRDHHRALGREPMTLVVRLVGPAAAVAATVEEHHDGQRTAGARPRRPDVEVQAVLADREVLEDAAARTEAFGHAAIPVEDAHALHAGGRERRGRTGHAPAHEVHGRAPTQSADGRLSERQAEVGIDARRGRRCPDHRLAVDRYPRRHRPSCLRRGGGGDR